MPNKEQKELSAMTKDEWNTYFSGHWYFAGAKQDGHIAMFPDELPSRLIKMFAFAGDTVLDPFLGSGTTSLAARNLCRNSVGYEINPDFIPIVKDRLNINQSDLAETEYEDVVLQKSGGLDDVKWFKLADILDLNFYDDILPIVTKSINLLIKS